MTTNIYTEIAKILEECVQEKQAVEVALKCLRPYERIEDNFLREVIHFVHHYYADDDIRRKDSEYAEYQNQKLVEYIVALKEKSQEK